MNCYQRRRARGVDGHRRAAKAQQVGDPPDRDGVRVAGRGVGIDSVGVGRRNRLVFPVIHAHQHRGAHTGQILCCDPGMLESLVGHLQHQPLLRVHRFGFAWGNTEVVRVEAGDIGQKSAPFRRHPAGRELIWVVVLVGVPAVRRDFADPVATGRQEVPITRRAHRATGEAAADADHCNRLGGGYPRRLIELLSQRVSLVAGHCRNSVVNRCHQKIPLSLLADADSTLSNNSSNTLLAESAADSAVASSGSSAGVSRPAT